MSNNNGSTHTGVGFFGLLGLLFIGLKLTGFIDWPWWIVLSPIWGWTLFVIVAIVIVVVVETMNDPW